MALRGFSLLKKSFRSHQIERTFRRSLVLMGIETSCDDTGVAIVNEKGEILGESLHSQQNIHLRLGGITPPRAQDLHRRNIERVVEECLKKSNKDVSDLDGIAVTNRPGLPLSLLIGLRYAKHLGRTYKKPLVPVHHMEAHALIPRMTEKIEFPFLCLLISGGHCQLTFVKDPFEFYLLGESMDDAPGECFDKIARRLKLRNLEKFEWLNGGAAIELAAKDAKNINRFEFPLPLARYRDCMFSFAGLKNNATRTIKYEERINDLKVDSVIPHYADFCAGFLKAVTRHISNRTQRAIEFCLAKNLFSTSVDPESNVKCTMEAPKSLVISGGVACNDFIFGTISKMAKKYNFETFRPPKKYCSDNGVMIAWNGIEKVQFNPERSLNYDYDGITMKGKCTLGQSLIEDVRNSNIKCKWVKMESVA